MGSWGYSNVGIAFDRSKNDELLIRQTMECLGYKESEFLYLEGTGVTGPQWDLECNDIDLSYLNEEREDGQKLYCILNILYKDISVYSVNASGSTISDCYSGDETTFDPIDNREKRVRFDYCYGDGTAFGCAVRGGDLEAKGTIEYNCPLIPNFLVTYIDPKHFTLLINEGTKKGYAKLVELVQRIKKELIDNAAEIKDGVLVRVSSIVTEYTIPDNVSQIGWDAFSCCRALKSVIIPDSVTKVGREAFSCCGELSSVKIPKSVVEIGAEAFYCCFDLVDVSIPESVVAIGFQAFEGTPWLKARKEEFVVLGDGILYKYNGTGSDVTVPKGIKYISSNAFRGCRDIKSIALPDSVKKIEDWAFADCENLESVTISDGTESIGSYAFCGCEKIRNITLPADVKEIGESAFYRCSILEEITLSENLTSIGIEVFSGCKSLKSITIPSGIVTIGNNVFKNCKSLRSITLLGEVKKMAASSVSKCEDVIITAPKGCAAIKLAIKKGFKYIET